VSQSKKSEPIPKVSQSIIQQTEPIQTNEPINKKALHNREKLE